MTALSLARSRIPPGTQANKWKSCPSIKGVMFHVSWLRYAKINTADLVITDFNLARRSYRCSTRGLRRNCHNSYDTNRLPWTRRRWQCFHTEKSHITVKSLSEIFWQFSKENTVINMQRKHDGLPVSSKRQSCAWQVKHVIGCCFMSRKPCSNGHDSWW